MKKQLLSFVLMMMSLAVSAAGVEIDGIHYDLYSDTQTAWVTYINYDYNNNYYGNIIIPSTVTYENVDYTVTEIGWAAFQGSYVTSVTIPNSVTKIGQQAFYHCTNLKSIVIPNSVTDIGYQAFHNCYGLTSVTMGNGVTNIGSSAFSSCEELKKVIVSDIAAWCGIIFDDSQANPLQYAKHLYSDENTEIKELVIPNNVTSIGNNAFSSCIALNSVTIGNSVTTIGNNAFSSCIALNSVTIGNSVTTIGNNAFSSCIALNSVTIGNSVATIGSSAFYACTALSTVVIPNSVTSVGLDAFSGTAWYDNQPDGLVYAGKNVYKYKGTMPDNTSIAIEDGTFSITGSAFKWCTNLTSITIPNSVTIIGSSAFSGCSGLTSITIPNSVLSLGYSVFYNCSGLTSITIPNSVTTIPEGMFQGCTGLTSVTIGSGVTSIEKNAFQNCAALSSMTILCEIVGKWFDGNGYYNPSSLPPLTEIVFAEGVKTINDNAFNGFSSIKTIDFANTVTSIGAKAFSGTNKLTDVTCRAINVPEMDRTTFENSYPNYATLHVPAVSLTAYKETAPWSEFKEVVAIKQDLPVDAEQCATPTISYQNGKLLFASATEGVEYQYQITDNDIKTGVGAEISVDATYYISVYATKEGYKDSEIATATLCWIDQKPATEGITNDIANIPANPVLIQSENGILRISGVPANTDINIYDMSGKMVGSGISSAESSNIATSLRRGDVAIVKIGENSVKVVIK